MPNSRQVFMLSDNVCHDPSERVSGKATENSPLETTHLPASLRQKPLQQALCTTKLAANHRSPNGQTVVADDFAK